MINIDYINHQMWVSSQLYYGRSQWSQEIKDVLANPENIRKLEQEYKFPITGDLEQFLVSYHKHYYTCDSEFYEDWDLEKVKDYLSQDRPMEHVVGLMNCAIKKNRIPIVHFLIDTYHIIPFESGLSVAAQSGNKEIIELMLQHIIETEDNTIFDALKKAAGAGHLEIIHLLLPHITKDHAYHLGWTIYNCNDIMREAAYHGHKDILIVVLDFAQKFLQTPRILEKLSDQHPNCRMIDLNGIMGYAALKDQTEIVEFMVQSGADDFNKTLWASASHGNLKIVQLMLACGADDSARALVGGTKNIEVVRVLLDHISHSNPQIISTKILRNAIWTAHYYDRPESSKLIEEWIQNNN